MNNQDQLEIPIQPVENPILCNPYEEPYTHWLYDTETGEAIRQPGRREAGYWYRTEHETEQDRAKHTGAKRWVSAVSNWGKYGKWKFHVCRDPQLLREQLATFQHGSTV